ncbi:MAG: hypothetical protein EZS28_052145, partial [Streblomastix strix]
KWKSKRQSKGSYYEQKDEISESEKEKNDIGDSSDDNVMKKTKRKRENYIADKQRKISRSQSRSRSKEYVNEKVNSSSSVVGSGSGQGNKRRRTSEEQYNDDDDQDNRQSEQQSNKNIDKYASKSTKVKKEPNEPQIQQRNTPHKGSVQKKGSNKQQSKERSMSKDSNSDN